MTKKHDNCEECGHYHSKRGLRLAHGRLLCYQCFLALTVRIPGKYTKAYQNRLKREFEASEKEDEPLK